MPRSVYATLLIVRMFNEWFLLTRRSRPKAFCVVSCLPPQAELLSRFRGLGTPAIQKATRSSQDYESQGPEPVLLARDRPLQ